MLYQLSSDRIGRSMHDLLETLQIPSTGLGLYMHTQALDTTTPAGRALYFAELEREIIVARVNAGMARAKANGTKSSKAVGRPRVSRKTEAAVRAALANGTGKSQRRRRTV